MAPDKKSTPKHQIVSVCWVNKTNYFKLKDLFAVIELHETFLFVVAFAEAVEH